MLGRRAAEDAEQSFRAFVVARRPALLRTAWLLTGNRDDAEDLVQTALVKVARRWPALLAGGDPEPYVRAVLITSHISAWRSASRRVATVTLPDSEPADGRTAQDGVGNGVGDRVVLAAALARLTPKQRAVLVLRFYEDLTEVQTAKTLGVGVGTVKSQVRDALARLRAVAPELADFEPPDRQEVTP